MTIYTGYVSIPHSTYDEWRAETLDNGYNYDNTYGCQCYDLAVEFWYNVGFPQWSILTPTVYPIITNSEAYTMWNNRVANASYNGIDYFDIITDVNAVKRGDVMVFNYTESNPYGHVGFADVDYTDFEPDPNDPYEFPILSQNNGGTPVQQGGTLVNVHGYDIRLFLGAFRYKEWHTTPPTPPVEDDEHRFPWVLYARKLRNKRQGL